MASNIVSTVDQTRQDFQASAADGLLKNVYIPALNNTTFHATPLIEMFGEFGGSIDFTGNKIIKAFKYQGAGGFGAISEGGDFVQGRDQKGFQGYERIKRLNAYFSLTGPAARTVKAGEGAYVDAISSGMDDTLRLAKMQMERMIGGSGNGELCRFTIGAINEAAMVTGEYVKIVAGATDTTPVALTATGGAYSAVQWLQEGLRVHLVKAAEFDGVMNTVDLTGPFEVSLVDYAAGTFALKYVGTVNLDIASKLASDDAVIVLENSYGQIESDYGTTADSCLEINGLGNLVSATGTVWGKTRTDYPHSLKSVIKPAGSAELDEELLMQWVLDLVNYKQSIPNVLVTDPRSRLKYFSNRKEDRRFDTTVIDTMFGFKSIGVVIDQYSLMLQSLTSLAPGTLYMLNTNAFKFAKATNGFEWIQDGSSILRNKEGSDNVFATAINYINFVCEDPKGQLKATNIAYA